MSILLSSKAELKKLNISDIVIALMLLCSLLTGVLPQQILSICIIILCVILCFRDELFLVYPFVIFYNELYGIIFGMSVSRIVTLMLLAILCVKSIKKITLNNTYIAPILVYVLYSLFVITEYSVQRAIFSIVDIFCCVFIIVQYLNESSKLKRFFTVYILVSLVACVSGMVLENVYIQAGTMSRFMSTFEDPNYMGYFYTIAAFSLMSLKLFRPWVRYILLVVIYCIILSALSMSSLLVNVILWLVFLVITHKIKINTFIIGLLSVIVLVSLYQYGLDHPNAEILGQLALRIRGTISKVLIGDINNATTGRFEYAEAHLEWFLNQSFWKIVFGGTASSTQYISYPFKEVAHNEYVDMLLNVGLVGTSTLLGFTTVRLIQDFREYTKNLNENNLCKIMIKCAWMLYCFTLTVFMDYRFAFAFFI